MCDICKKVIFSGLDYIIKDTCGHSITICPNCVTMKVYQGEMEEMLKDFHSDPYASEISGEVADVIVVDQKTEYYLTRNEAVRLFGHRLNKEEYKKLIEHGRSTEEFLLHDDFYDEDGQAMQPKIDEIGVVSMLSELDKKELIIAYDGIRGIEKVASDLTGSLSEADKNSHLGKAERVWNIIYRNSRFFHTGRDMTADEFAELDALLMDDNMDINRRINLIFG